MEPQLNLWNEFCNQHFPNKFAIPLFSTSGKVVNTKNYGQNNRIILKRSNQMEALVIEEVSKVLTDFKQGTNVYEGLIYMMYWLDEQQVISLYIGKSEKYGTQGNNLSINIKDISSNKNFFCRWGDSYAYHIGDLSAVVCPGHPPLKVLRKYEKWAHCLFESYPTPYPTLRRAIYFWIQAWENGSVGIWKEVGSTPLTALEYHLIFVASNVFPVWLLNQEGVNRKRKA
jgi:hypothetical protein